MCTFEREKGKTGNMKNKFAQFDHFFLHVFFGILSKLLCAKFSVRKFAFAKKFTFKRSGDTVGQDPKIRIFFKDPKIAQKAQKDIYMMLTGYRKLNSTQC